MPFFTGRDGSLFVAPRTDEPNSDGIMPNEKEVAKTRGWTFSSSTVTHDCTSLGDTDRIFREGLRNATGTAEIYYYTTSDDLGNITELLEYALGERDVPGSGPISDDEPQKFTLKFVIGRTSTKRRYLVCRVAITSLQITQATGEVCMASLSFDVNGAPVQYSL